MARNFFEHTIETTLSMDDAFIKLQDTYRDYDEDREDYDYVDIYDLDHNGEISSTLLKRTYKNYSYDKYNKKHEKEVLKIVNVDTIPEGETYGFDLGIVGYEVTTVDFQKYTETKKPKYAKKYVVTYRNSQLIIDTELCDSLAEAKEKSIELVTAGYSVLYITSEYVLVEGSDNVCRVRSNTEIVKRKPKNTKNKIIKEIHKYYFAGCAYYEDC